MAREYFHNDKLGVNPVLGEKQVPYKSSNVLAIQAKTAVGHDYTVVPGVLISYRGRFSGRVPVSEVQPVKPRERQNLEKLLREAGLKGPLSFW